MRDLYLPFWQKLNDLNFPELAIDALKKKVHERLDNPIQGDYPRWFEAYKNLPTVNDIQTDTSKNAINCQAKHVDKALIKLCYEGLIPWRKGPFDIFETFIDSEWQSYLKWNRIANQLPSLHDKLVLDVGCGNGYYLFRMLQEKPLLLMGIDPGLLQVMQFWSIEKYVQSQVCVLPLAIENMPKNLNIFDVVFSMGVLYHRKSPIHHLKELADTIKSRGHVVLETLIVDGDENTCLIPSNRYAQMRNVWFLPSIKMLIRMLQRTGFQHIQCIDVTETTTTEQRTTPWMKFHSLEQFLNEDKSKTIEGYPLPKRATLVAEKK